MNTRFVSTPIIRNRMAYHWIVFILFVMVYMYDHIQIHYGFSFTDEILMLLLLLYWFAKAKNKTGGLKIVVGVFIVYLINSLLFPHNVIYAILSDFIQQLKPFAAFYCMYDLGIELRTNQTKKICKICMFLAILMLPIGILNIGGGNLMVDYFGGYARFSSIAICLGTTYYFFSKRDRKAIFVCLAIFGVGLLSTRSKMFGFYVVALLVFFFWKIPKRIKVEFFTWKNLLMLFFVVVCVYFVAKEKILFYFVEGAQAQNMFARPLLYSKAVEILNDYPWFGTGFGSYATDASAKYYSPLYYQYNLYLSPEIGNGLFISDTWFPVLAQFGCVGIVLYVLFWRSVFLKAKNKYNMTHNSSDFKLAVLIIAFFFIESVADSTFTQNRGMYMMMLLALSVRNPRYTLKPNEKDIIYSK